MPAAPKLATGSGSSGGTSAACVVDRATNKEIKERVFMGLL
jgi:hypothetical protein